MTPRTRRTAGAGLVVTAWLTGLPAAEAESSAAQACAAYSSSHEASELPDSFADTGCSWTGRVVRDTGIGVSIPARGEQVQVDALGLAGSRWLRVAHGADGRITIIRDSGTAGRSSTAPSTPLPACSDGAFDTEGFKVSGGYEFSYNGYSAPANLAAGTPAALSNAFIKAASAATNCAGATRHPGPAPRYVGTISGRFANVSTTYTCSSPDGYNTVSWMPGDNHTLAITCMWSSGGVLRSSDAAINRALPFFTGAIPDRCSVAFDLQGVMTHEAGHTYGLGHADAGTSDTTVHANQTMNSQLAPCTIRFRTFGTGDLNGMTAIY